MIRDPHRLLARLLDGTAPAGTRSLIAVAHPDDEVLGCGALLARLPGACVLHVTDGAPRNGADAARHGFADPAAYAATRRVEAVQALAIAGVPADHIATLQVGDQEAAHRLAEIARRLAAVMSGIDVVFTHAFEGGHADHDAVAFAVRAARGQMPPDTRPIVVEMPFYHAGPDGWVRQTFLPQAGAAEEQIWRLDADRQALKRRMLAAHRSQGETLASFAVDVERFRVAPPYDFEQRPHGGDLLYERHGWNLDWPTWVANVRRARRELGLGAT